MESIDYSELRFELEQYFQIENRIKTLKETRSKVSQEFYALHSLVGGMSIGGALNYYQRPYTPEQSAVLIMGKEQVIDVKIDRLKLKKKVMTDFFKTINVNELQFDLKQEVATEVVLQFNQEKSEIEEYLERMILYKWGEAYRNRKQFIDKTIGNTESKPKLKIVDEFVEEAEEVEAIEENKPLGLLERIRVTREWQLA